MVFIFLYFITFRATSIIQKRLPPLYYVGERHGFILHIGGNYRVWMKWSSIFPFIVASILCIEPNQRLM
jgi:hypothetical protein